MQVDIGKERRYDRSLPCPLLTGCQGPIIEDARSEPFLDQAENARVADSVFQETDEPFLAHFVEERPDVGVQNVVHPPVGNSDHQRVQRIVLPTPRAEPVREPEEVLLVYRVQDFHRAPLDDFVFQGGDGKWPLPAIRLRYEPPPCRQSTVRSSMDSVVQIREPKLQVPIVIRPRQPIYTGGCSSLEREEGGPETIDAEVVEERGEPLPSPFLRCFPHASQRL